MPSRMRMCYGCWIEYNGYENFAAIDFETANECRSSVCSVDVVIVKDCKIVDKFYSLIHPVPDYYSYWNTQVHGLTEVSTRPGPSFPEVWAQVSPCIENLPLVAHNSSFDESCLKAVFSTYGMAYPGYRFSCTCRASRRVLGKRIPNHQLQTVAQYCGYDLKHHHHAMADAEACARIAIEILDF